MTSEVRGGSPACSQNASIGPSILGSHRSRERVVRIPVVACSSSASSVSRITAW